jgi:hypothetical protein
MIRGTLERLKTPVLDMILLLGIILIVFSATKNHFL